MKLFSDIKVTQVLILDKNWEIMLFFLSYSLNRSNFL